MLFKLSPLTREMRQTPAQFLLGCLSFCLVLLCITTFSAYHFLKPVWAPSFVHINTHAWTHDSGMMESSDTLHAQPQDNASHTPKNPQSFPAAQTSFTPLLDVLYPFAISFLIAIIVTMGVAMVCVVRTSLHTHQDVIDILRLMGATQHYIAQQFQWITFLLGFKACIYGVVCGLMMLGIGHILTHYDIITSIPLLWDHRVLGICAGIPLLGGILGLLTAHIEIARTLQRMEHGSVALHT